MKSFKEFLTEQKLDEAKQYVIIGTDLNGPSAGKVTKVYDGKTLSASEAQKVTQKLNANTSPGSMGSTHWFAGEVGKLPAKENAVSNEVKKALGI